MYNQRHFVLLQICTSSTNLAHLSKLFVMYMEKSYHRPRATWLDSVCRYINDVFGHLCRAHITFLLEVYIAIVIIIGSQLRIKRSAGHCKPVHPVRASLSPTPVCSRPSAGLKARLVEGRMVSC